MAYGEVLWDLLPGSRKLGGAPFNFINRVNTLGNRGIMVSRRGPPVKRRNNGPGNLKKHGTFLSISYPSLSCRVSIICMADIITVFLLPVSWLLMAV